jgi:hypothetical protein
MMGVLQMACLAILGAVASQAPPSQATRLVAVSRQASDAEQVRRAVDDVLSRREFADLSVDESVWLKRLSVWLGSLLGKVGDLANRFPWLIWIVVAWLVLTLLAILVNLIWTLYVWLKPSGGVLAPARQPVGAGLLHGVRALQFDDVYRRSRELLEQRDYAAAVRHLYVAAILWLDRQGQIAFATAKTNRDYQLELTGKPAYQQQFAQLTERFETIAYGSAAATMSDCREMTSVLEALQHSAGA